MGKGRWEHFLDQNLNNPIHAHTMIKNNIRNHFVNNGHNDLKIYQIDEH
jgi:hypothetical protein